MHRSFPPSGKSTFLCNLFKKCPLNFQRIFIGRGIKLGYNWWVRHTNCCSFCLNWLFLLMVSELAYSIIWRQAAHLRIIYRIPLNPLCVASESKPPGSSAKSQQGWTETKSSESYSTIFHFALVINVSHFPFLEAPAFTENIVGNSPICSLPHLIQQWHMAQSDFILKSKRRSWDVFSEECSHITTMWTRKLTSVPGMTETFLTPETDPINATSRLRRKYAFR